MLQLDSFGLQSVVADRTATMRAATILQCPVGEELNALYHLEEVVGGMAPTSKRLHREVEAADGMYLDQRQEVVELMGAEKSKGRYYREERQEAETLSVDSRHYQAQVEQGVGTSSVPQLDQEREADETSLAKVHCI